MGEMAKDSRVRGRAAALHCPSASAEAWAPREILACANLGRVPGNAVIKDSSKPRGPNKA